MKSVYNCLYCRYAALIKQMNLPWNLQTLIQEGEGYLIEFKESPSQHMERDLCAFANGSGGTLYIGVRDSGEVKPTPLTNRLKAQLQAAARNCDPPVEIDVVSAHDLVLVKIAESTHKPVRAPDGFYLRVGATSQKLTREEILSFAIKENRILFDSQLYVEKTTPECLNPRRVEIFRQRAHLEESLDNEHLLQNLGGLKFQNHRSYLTFAGILLFGQDPQQIFPQATITLLHMENDADILEQRILRGTLFEQVENAFVFLKSHLRTRPEIRGLQREDVPEFPEPVLRELIVNALVHRDYFERAADVSIKILPTRIEFSNPGRVSSTIPLHSLYGRSFRRNPLIADFFYRARYIERAGTGLLRVREALLTSELPPLELTEEGPFFIATLQRPQSLTEPAHLNERQSRLFSFPAEFFPFDSKGYAKRFEVSERMARIDIQDLVKKGLLLLERRGRKIRYQRPR